jgi:hypothetical protein
MKTLIKINFLLITAIVFCNLAQAQQKASDKSFNTVLNEVKQRQAMRNKMLLQVRQTTPNNNSQINNTDIKPNAVKAGGTTKQTTTSGEGANQQAANSQPSNQPVKIQRPKKQ